MPPELLTPRGLGLCKIVALLALALCGYADGNAQTRPRRVQPPPPLVEHTPAENSFSPFRTKDASPLPPPTPHVTVISAEGEVLELDDSASPTEAAPQVGRGRRPAGRRGSAAATGKAARGKQRSGYYVNVDGERVRRPVRSKAVPEGASAQCRDGTYSFSRNRRGTCSHHGGVARWL